MKRMRLIADVTFDAEGIDDALAQWRDHFASLIDGADDEPVKNMLGEIHIRPVEEADHA